MQVLNNNNPTNIMSVNQLIRTYPLRYSKIAFDELYDMLQNAELKRDYITWKSGINYKTNQQIEIGGILHQQLADKFMIHYPHNYVHGHCFGKNPVLFVDLVDIDVNSYLQETEQIKNEVDEFNYKLNETKLNETKLNNDVISSL